MIARSLAALLAAACWLAAEGAEPKGEPEEYGAQGRAGDLTVAASYYSRSFNSGGRSYFLDKYLVVEAAIYGPPLRRAEVSNAHFTLRVNGARQGILPVAGSLAAYDVKWRGVDRGIRAQAGPVILGGPGAEQRFPGDRREIPVPRAPDSKPGGVEREPEPDLAKSLTDAALPQGDALALPVSGYLYFPFDKKLKSIKKIDLTYEGPSGTATLKLK
ncbi:MAG: hypothetical protein KIT09_33120 [Bryobacteraceae bacterium]|nr:hypothetical protein [Bryobacteraceae bacterium]